MTTPNTPEPAKWAVEDENAVRSIVAACIVFGGECDQLVSKHAKDLTERVTRNIMQWASQRHADSAMEEMRKRIADLQGQLDLDRQDRNDLREQLMATAAELAKVNEQAAIAGRQLAAAEDELERWQSTFEAWGEEPAEAHDKIIAASDERVEEIKKDAEEWEKTLDAQVEVNFKLQAECGRLMELEDNLRAQLAAAEAKVEELEKDRERLAFIRTNCEVTYNGRLIEDIAELDAARTPKETSQ